MTPRLFSPRFPIAPWSVVFVASFCLTSFANELAPEEKQFLAKYEEIHVALAADNLANAKKAATGLGDEGKLLAQTESIITARREFETLSGHAIQLTSGQSGYYVVNCPMLKKDWVQTSEKISNPYAGVSMLTCGVVKK